MRDSRDKAADLEARAARARAELNEYFSDPARVLPDRGRNNPLGDLVGRDLWSLEVAVVLAGRRAFGCEEKPREWLRLLDVAEHGEHAPTDGPFLAQIRRHPYFIFATGAIQQKELTAILVDGAHYVRPQDFIRWAEKTLKDVSWPMAVDGFKELVEDALKARPGVAEQEAQETAVKSKQYGGRKPGRKPKQGTLKNIAHGLGVKKWEAIQMGWGENIIVVVAGNRNKKFALSELGITEATGRLLLSILDNSGYKSREDLHYQRDGGSDTFSLHLSRLNAALRGAFGIDENPLRVTGGAVETRFKIIDFDGLNNAPREQDNMADDDEIAMRFSDNRNSEYGYTEYGYNDRSDLEE